MISTPATGSPPRHLEVKFESRLVGMLQADDDGRSSFRYDAAWLANGFPISLSLPLNDADYRTEAQRFFANLLPEGIVREMVARRLGISAANDWALLAALGGDCAGALTLRPPDSPVEVARYRQLSADDLRTMAAMEHPGLASLDTPDDVRLSLAGAQDKLPVLIDDGAYWLPVGGAPSSHIIKFANRDFAHLPANEVLMTRLARSLGLNVVDAGLDLTIDPCVCVVERYDREGAAEAADPGDPGHLRRIHQEDLCQALALDHATKYEADGGPGLAAIHAAIDAAVVDPIGDTRELLRWIAFNVIVGNADGHAKNLSLVHTGGVPRLAPFYDLVCTRAYPAIARHMAFSVAGEADPGNIGRSHWLRLGEQFDIRPTYVVDLVDEMTGDLDEKLAAIEEGFRDDYRDPSVLQLVPPIVRRQSRRTRHLLAT